jgi:hypothetical protein
VVVAVVVVAVVVVVVVDGGGTNHKQSSHLIAELTVLEYATATVNQKQLICSPVTYELP